MSRKSNNKNLSDSGTVDVIVPVYRGFEQTRRCLEAVLDERVETPFELVVIDDCSPDPELRAYLGSTTDRPHVTLLVNERNLGFVAAVNQGMALHPDRDVVLLNSDTEVANDWLDRLRACVHRAADIGTATPFSNNATICSYPLFCVDNPLPPDSTVAELDVVFRSVNAGAAVDIPTAVGFCMYIRRACLDRVGAFDAERFGRGYGEENDFSRRAAKAGWRNVLCADVFVFHEGGISFRDERETLTQRSSAVMDELHPDYHDLVRRFIANDTPAPYRHAVDVELARARLAGAGLSADSDRTKPVLLHILHDLGGGIVRWLDDFRRADTRCVNLVLRPYCRSRDFGEGLMLFLADVDGERPLALWRFAESIPACVDSHPEYRRVLTEIVHRYGVGAVLVSSLIGHALDALDTGLPTLIVNHDFFPLCPAINLHFQHVCTECDEARLRACTQANSCFNLPYIDFPAEVRLALRARYLELIAGGRVALVVPDVSVRTHLQRVFPATRASAFVIIEHGIAMPFAPIATAGEMPERRLRVVVLGMLAVSKGGDLLRAGLDRLLEFADVYLVGAREVGELFLDRPGVHVVEEYAIEVLPAILADIRPDVGLLLSIWPESFSYTLSELWMLGIPPAATRLGAFAERIRPGETGYLFEPDVESMLSCLRAIEADRAGLRVIAANLRDTRARGAAEMVADYHRLLPLGTGSVPPDRLDRPTPPLELERLAWAQETIDQWKTIKHQHLLLDMRAERVAELHARADDLRESLIARECALEALAGRLQARENENEMELARCETAMAQVYASTSWQVSRPVRWLGLGVRKSRMFWRLLKPILSRPATRREAIQSLLGILWRDGTVAFKQALAERSAAADHEGEGL
jgi:GT2 family glycosyltransferase